MIPHMVLLGLPWAFPNTAETVPLNLLMGTAHQQSLQLDPYIMLE